LRCRNVDRAGRHRCRSAAGCHEWVPVNALKEPLS
jgi:hypothetical protein